MTEDTYSEELTDDIERSGYDVEAVQAWASYTGRDVTEWDRPTRNAFEDDYQGEHKSEEEFAEDLAESLGFVPMGNSWPINHIDWEGAAHDLFSGDYWSQETPGGHVWVFRV